MILPSAVPVRVDVPAGTHVTAIRAGCFCSLVLTRSGRVLAFGRNDLGELGDGMTRYRDRPVAVRLPRRVRVRTMSAGNSDTLVLTTGGHIYGWGFDAEGQLGDGAYASSDVPVMVSLAAGVTAAAAATGPGALNSSAVVGPAPAG